MTAAFGTSFVGRRSNNEDNFGVCQDIGLYVVADGMGGHEGGEVASRLAVDALTRYFEDAPEPTLDLSDPETGERRVMASAISSARASVLAAATGELAEMGTTLAALWLRGKTAMVAHVGDSRIYRLRGRRLEQLTMDHSFVAEVERAYGREALRRVPDDYWGVVTRCLAPASEGHPDIQMVDTLPGDVFLLCSDGLNESLSDRDIAAILGMAAKPDVISKTLVRRAYEAGSQDNITCVVVRAGANEDILA